jgi:hypothetical protein
MLFDVEVKQQGSPVGEHRIEAPDPLTAINLVERRYGDPPKVEYASIEDEEGNLHPVLTVSGWHGYTFVARLGGPWPP